VQRAWSELEAPPGWRPEIIPERIVMTPPPSIEHNVIAAKVNRALVGALGDGLELFQTLGVGVESVGGIFVPDFCVVVEEQLPSGGPGPVASEHVVLAVEITSRGNAAHDRKRKRWAYAHGGIAQYLLIDAFDPQGPAVSLFSAPAEGEYQSAVRVGFGQTIPLAAPVKLDLDTRNFPVG
jgi:Uma2 family endonuclease